MPTNTGKTNTAVSHTITASATTKGSEFTAHLPALLTLVDSPSKTHTLLFTILLTYRHHQRIPQHGFPILLVAWQNFFHLETVAPNQMTTAVQYLPWVATLQRLLTLTASTSVDSGSVDSLMLGA